MITIKELLELKCTQNFKLIAGKNGLNREVVGLGIFEYELNQNLEHFFSKGDLILTTLFFAKDNIDLAEEAIVELLNNTSISGLAIKNICFENFSPKVIECANNRAIPLFVFHDTFFEDIIVRITETIKSKNDNSILENKVKSIINKNVKKFFIEKTALQINDLFYNNIISAYCEEKKYVDDSKLIKTLSILRLSKNKHLHNIGTSIFKYEKGILILYSFENPKGKLARDSLFAIIDALKINKNSFYIGISDIHHNINELNLCIEKSLFASLSCRNRKENCLDFKNTGIDKIVLPLSNNYWIKEYYQNIIESLIEYDNRYDTNLLITAISYVNNNGKIEPTSKELSQHRNTTRYKIDQIKQLTNMTNLEENFYVQLFLAIKLYETQKNKFSF
jgi:hypothetical protein